MRCHACNHEMSAAEEIAYRAHMGAKARKPHRKVERPRCGQCGALVKAGAPCKRCARSPFSMIEVVIALAVIAIGIMSVVALIPIGVRANNDALAASHAADAGQWIAQYLARSPALVDMLPWSPEPTAAMPAPPMDDPAWEPVRHQPGLWRSATLPGSLRFYAVRQRGALNTVVRCWRQRHVIRWFDGTELVSTMVHVELSWPATAEPRDRQRATFSDLAK